MTLRIIGTKQLCGARKHTKPVQSMPAMNRSAAQRVSWVDLPHPCSDNIQPDSSYSSSLLPLLSCASQASSNSSGASASQSVSSQSSAETDLDGAADRRSRLEDAVGTVKHGYKMVPAGTLFAKQRSNTSIGNRVRKMLPPLPKSGQSLLERSLRRVNQFEDAY